jgi:Family of unknown function (DUF6011)
MVVRHPVDQHHGVMTTDRPLPGLATDEELSAGRTVIRCTMCGRPLTDRAARIRGLGEGCRHKLTPTPTLRRPARFEVPQDELPVP